MAGNYDKNSNINLSGNINKVYGSLCLEMLIGKLCNYKNLQMENH